MFLHLKTFKDYVNAFELRDELTNFNLSASVICANNINSLHSEAG